MNRRLNLNDYNRLCSRSEREAISRIHGLVDFTHVKSETTPSPFNPNNLRHLYEHLFDNPNERIAWSRLMSSIVDRDADWKTNCVTGSKEGKVVAFTFFKSGALNSNEFITAIMYIGIADLNFMKQEYGVSENFRGSGISKALYLLSHAITSEDAAVIGVERVNGSILDSELIGQAGDDNGIKYTKKRLEIHGKSGAMAIMLDMGSGSLMIPIVQPRMSNETNPLLLHLLYRPRYLEDYDMHRINELEFSRGKELVMAYMNSFKNDADPVDILEANVIVQNRLALSRRILLVPAEQLPDMIALAKFDYILKQQIERDYGPILEHSRKVLGAFDTQKEKIKLIV